ncbi:MAG: hypothetical protein AB1736_06410 [Chloroflexota bacterium]
MTEWQAGHDRHATGAAGANRLAARRWIARTATATATTATIASAIGQAYADSRAGASDGSRPVA